MFQSRFKSVLSQMHLYSGHCYSTASEPRFIQYGGRYLATLIPGDGIGRELCSIVRSLFKELAIPVDFEEVQIASTATGDMNGLSNAMESLKRTKVGLKGILYTPISGGHTSYNVTLRKELDIFANVIPIKSVAGAPSRFTDIDFFIIRENTEGEYSGLEHTPVPGVIESLKVTTLAKSERIIQFAMDWAVRHGRKKVTCVHKANIMKLTDGLFLKVFRQMALSYKSSGIIFDDMIVDNAAMQMVSKPHQFDVIVTPNLYGSICTQIGAALVGGPGLIPGCNIGHSIALFEPGARHVGMDIKDRNCANPTSMILSSCWMLRHLGLEKAAERIESSVQSVIAESKIRTPDLKGSNTTTEFCEAVIQKYKDTATESIPA